MESWLQRQTDRALEGLEGSVDTGTIEVSSRIRQRAFEKCAGITAAYSKTFSMAARMLPPEKARGIQAQYAFCRLTDNIADRPSSDPDDDMRRWRQRVMRPDPESDDLVPLAWALTRERFQIPDAWVQALIDGVSRDLTQRRYETFDDLVDYCYGVASTVGLMSMQIIGYSGPEAIPYAVKLGVALQITNILRDVGEDWKNGRLYLPRAELDGYGISEEDVANGVVTDKWRRFMEFQIARNRRLYHEAWPGIAMLDRSGQFAVAAAADLYSRILNDIEAHDHDVFNWRAYVPRWRKLMRLPAIWLRLRFAQSGQVDTHV